MYVGTHVFETYKCEKDMKMLNRPTNVKETYMNEKETYMYVKQTFIQM